MGDYRERPDLPKVRASFLNPPAGYSKLFIKSITLIKVMIKKIEGSEFELTTDPQPGAPFYTFGDKTFRILKFRRQKIERAPMGFSVKIEHQWRNGRTKIECLPFEEFKEKYLKLRSAIFLDGAATLHFVLGFNENGNFVPARQMAAKPGPDKPLNADQVRIKRFKVRFYYELYV